MALEFDFSLYFIIDGVLWYWGGLRFTFNGGLMMQVIKTLLHVKEAESCRAKAEAEVSRPDPGRVEVLGVLAAGDEEKDEQKSE